MSKYLFVSTYDIRRNTSSNIRLVALMKALHDAGHEVHCIYIPTSQPSDLEMFNAASCIDRIVSFPKAEFKPILERKEKSGNQKGSFKNKLRLNLIHLYTRFTVYDVYEMALRKLTLADLSGLDDDYDYILSSSEPRSSHKFAKMIIRLKNYSAKWIMYWGDPMTNDVASTRLFSSRERREEHRLLKMADIALYTNKCAVEYMTGKYPDCKNKIDWIPTSDIKPHCVADNSIIEEYVGYFGDYSPVYRNIFPFYEACAENEIKTIIAGGGGGVVINSTNTVEVKGRISRSEVNELEKKCKLLIVIENKTATGKCIQIPGKLYHYGLSNKKVLVITESQNLAQDYSNYNRFYFVPNCKDKIAKAIDDIMNDKESEVSSLPLKDFMPENIVRQLELVIGNAENKNIR